MTGTRPCFCSCVLSFLFVVIAQKAEGAQGHLEPDVSSLAHATPQKYERVLDDLFVLDDTVRFVVRVVIRPSWGPEHAVGIRCVDSTAEVFTLLADESVYHAGYSADGSGWDAQLARAVPVAQRTSMIDSRTAGLVYLAWASMILDTRYPDDAVMHLDGVNYLFSALIGGRGLLSGQTHSPRPGSATGALVELAKSLEPIVRGEDASPDSVAEQALDIIQRQDDGTMAALRRTGHSCLPREIVPE